MREAERRPLVNRAGIHYLAMAPLQRPRPIWTVDISSLGLGKQRFRRKPCESKCYGSLKSTEKPRRGDISSINHLFPPSHCIDDSGDRSFECDHREKSGHYRHRPLSKHLFHHGRSRGNTAEKTPKRQAKPRLTADGWAHPLGL